MERLLVVGGDAAGMSAASQARRRRPADELEIVVLERGRHTSYSACGIPYWIGDLVDGPDALVARTPAEFEELGIEVRLHAEAVSIDPDACRVGLADGTELEYDQLMLGLGAVPSRPPIDGIDAHGVYGVQTLDDGEAVRSAVDGLNGGRAVVIGGGYVGLELAEAMIQRGLDVTVLDAADEVMNTVDADVGARVHEAIEGMGIAVRTKQRITGIESADGRVKRVVTDDGGYDADIVVLGLGVRPNTGIVRAAGIATGDTGGVRTDIRMRTTSHPNVWAAGDCVETFHRVLRAPAFLPLGTHANKQGRVAGINLGGGYATFGGVLGTAVTKVCALEIARTGLTEAEAERAGFRHVTVTVESTTRAGYYPGAQPITVKVVAEQRTGRLLGAQIVGKEGAAKRIDVFATALWNDMTVEAIAGMDLSYAPPYAPVWDPVLIAARKAADQV